MYICNCMGITEREIRGAAELGCESVAGLSSSMGLGTRCGKCLPEAHGVLRRCGNACRVELRAIEGGD